MAKAQVVAMETYEAPHYPAFPHLSQTGCFSSGWSCTKPVAGFVHSTASAIPAQMHKAARQKLSNSVEYVAGAEHILADVDMHAALRTK